MKWALSLLAFASISVLAAELDACKQLNESQCIRSPSCTLVYIAHNRYQCRAAANKCELGFIQWIDYSNIKVNPNDPGQINYSQVESCEAKEGCKFNAGSGYCQPDVLCIAAGGSPPQCQLIQ